MKSAVKRYLLEAEAVKKVGAKSKRAKRVKVKSSMVLEQFVIGARSFNWSVWR